jgi:ABC-type multidrug transport system ATPase subunit
VAAAADAQRHSAVPGVADCRDDVGGAARPGDQVAGERGTGVERYLTVAETVALYASYYPRPRPVQEVIELVDLQDESGTRVLHLSGGQQRGLDVAVALVGDPELLFLDEPTTGFDPSARREAWGVVKRLAALDKTVLLTTHYMEEAEWLADRVAVVVKGRIVAEGPPARLAGRDRRRVRVRLQPPAASWSRSGASAGSPARDHRSTPRTQASPAIPQHGPEMTPVINPHRLLARSGYLS